MIAWLRTRLGRLICRYTGHTWITGPDIDRPVICSRCGNEDGPWVYRW